MKTYPVFLIGLDRRRCVVLGGGREAERKVRGLVDCDASVTVIAPTVTPALKLQAAEQRIAWKARDYRPGDLKGAFLVVSTLGDRPANERIWQEAEVVGALCNVVDDVDDCNFIAGSVVRRGALMVAISTGGHAPALAVRLREHLEQTLGPEYARFLELAAELRGPLLDRHPDFEQRRELWYRLVDSDVIDLLRDGRTVQARRRIADIVGHDVAPTALTR